MQYFLSVNIEEFQMCKWIKFCKYVWTIYYVYSVTFT